MKKVLYKKYLNVVSHEIDKAILDYIEHDGIETFESFPDFFIIAFEWQDFDNPESKNEKIMIYLDREDLFFICEGECSYKKVSALFDPRGTNEQTLRSFFEQLFRTDMKRLKLIEQELTDLEEVAEAGESSVFEKRLKKQRLALYSLKQYYAQLDSIFEEMLENTNALLTHECLSYIKILENRISRLLHQVISLREYLKQVGDVHRAYLDYTQNKLMRLFTVVTTIFLPLTLIVGWYGMNFNMPEFSFKYGYPLVILLSVSVCSAIALLFKKNKWL